MKDFKSSLIAGIESAKEASNNINEIKYVIKTVSQQVFEISHRKAIFALGEFSKPVASPFPGSMIGSLAQAMTPPPETYTALGIFNANGKEGVEIAKWTQHENGYPCSISFGTQRYMCSTKEELENAFSELFLQTKTGKAILDKISKP